RANSHSNLGTNWLFS
ncbi:chlamydia polymorphic membrane middle domain protein, partial [Chlamydia psittaci 09DC78]